MKKFMKKLLFIILFIGTIWLALSHFVQTQGLAGRGQYNSIIVNFKDDLPTSVLSEQMKAISADIKRPADFNSIFSIKDHLYTIPGKGKDLSKLRSSIGKDYLDYVEPNYIYKTLETPNDPDYGKQWNFRSIGVDKAWDHSQGEGVTVAIIDTGVSRVPDLRETEFVEGYNFVEDNNDTSDKNGHGTHVAGTIAQSTNNQYGVAGIAYKAKIMPLKVLSDGGGGTVADIAEAIEYAADHGASVINLSLGGGGESQTLKDAIDYAYSKGVVIVAAAGNENRNAASYPARYPKVISVAALDATGHKAPYSNFGAGIDIAAPGGSDGGKDGKILQETIDPTSRKPIFIGLQGTSMAAPHVAGTVALIQSAQLKVAKQQLALNPQTKGKAEKLTVNQISHPAEILDILKRSAQKVPEDSFNYYGAGQLNAGEAVTLTLKGKLSFQDFFRWLRDNGYLNPIFWFDGGAIALLPKVAMVLGSYLLAFFLRYYFPFSWTAPYHWGLILGSSGLFFLQGLYIFDLPQWPFRLLGSSFPELANSLQDSSLLNPFFASLLIPLGLMALLLGNRAGKRFAIGATLGVSSFLIVAALLHPVLWLIGGGAIAQAFLGINALLCLGLAWLASKSEARFV
jgi:serine protease